MFSGNNVRHLLAYAITRKVNDTDKRLYMIQSAEALRRKEKMKAIELIRNLERRAVGKDCSIDCVIVKRLEEIIDRQARIQESLKEIKSERRDE